ncbi:MAG: segregation/condensation protein A [Verrucomicrobia bacterium]|jgi:segregation and condensation protein A|nr:segregation/condensation protein A [Verrucomicrobiota bacterium]
MPVQEEYKVELEVFEGPLDLLLYLIKRDEVDIYDIPIERITAQYMEHLDVMRMLDLNIAGEFIVMAATLMMIKSRMLLPIEDQDEVEEEEDDPRWDLVRQLVEYKKFKDIANQLQEREFHQENVFDFGGKSAAVLEPDDPSLVMQDVSLFDLISAFNDVLKNAPPESIGEIAGEQYTVADKIDHVLKTIRRKGRIRFTEMFSKMASRHEVICTFLAMLELLRLRQVKAEQDNHFGEIVITQSEGDEPDPTPEAFVLE